MVVCRFWEQGRCKFGADCKFEHPGSERPPGFSRPRNAFEVLNRDSPGNDRYRSASPAKFGEAVPPNTYKLDESQIRTDLTTDLPVYIFSCYGPGKDAPLQLFGGQPREQSYEECRLRYYELAAENRLPEAKGEEDSMRTSAQQQIQSVLNDIPGAIRYIREGEAKHPNRIDVIEGRARSENETGIGRDESRQTSAFGRVEAPPNAGNPFARTGSQQPAFGATSFPGASNPLQQTQQQPEPPRIPGPFEAAAPQNPFSRAAPGTTQGFQQNAATSSPFGGVSPFGKPAMPSAVPAPNNPFAQTAAATRQNGQASNPFGTPGNAANPFATGGGAQAAPAANPFATGMTSPPAPASNPFARPTDTNSMGGQPSANGFGSNPTPAPASGFGAITMSPAAQANTATGAGDVPGFSLFNHQVPTHRPGVREFDGQGHLRRFKGQPTDFPKATKFVDKHEVEYLEYDKPFYLDAQRRKNRVWVVQEKNWYGRAADDPSEEAYTPAVREGLMHMLQSGTFKDGIMPEYPLPRADTAFDI